MLNLSDKHLTKFDKTKKSKKYSGLILLPLALVFLGSCGSNEKEDHELAAFLCPEIIDEKNLESLNGLGDYSKAIIAKNISYLADTSATGDNLDKVNGFLTAVGQNGVLTAYGDSFDVVDFGSNNGVANRGRFAGFLFLQDTKLVYTIRDTDFNLVDCNDTTVGDFDVGDKVHSGALVISKSFDNTNWQPEIYNTNVNRKYINYRPSSEDIFKGVYLRFLSSVQYSFIPGYSASSNTISRKKKQPIYLNLIQETTVYMAQDSFDIQFTCESIENKKIFDSSYNANEIEILSKATTLMDNSVSSSYINVNVGNIKSNSCTYDYFGKDKMESGRITENRKFTEPGKYIFKQVSPFGKTNNTTIYLLDVGDDYGRTTIFGTGIIDSSRRVFDSSRNFQTYLVGKEYHLKSLPDYIPGRYGSIDYFKDENDFKNHISTTIRTFSNDRTECNGIFELGGYYTFDVYLSPEATSGDVLHYTFTYYISNDTSYAPSVNRSLIKSPLRTNLLATKVYGVMLPTTGGGSYQFVFPYSEKYLSEAYELAVEIEELSVEIINTDRGKFYYYKSKDNPLVKVNYLNKVVLYDAINYYADKNLSVIYLENDIPFATEMVNKDNLKDITKTSLRTSVRVVSNERILNDLVSSEIYLNNYKFIQIADYEVDLVSYIDKFSEEKTIPFDTDLNTFFVSDEKVTIKEKNWNSATFYDAIYQKNNTCLIVAKVNGVETDFSLDADGSHIDCNEYKFISASDEFDSQTLIAISNGERRDVFSMNEINNLYLPVGDYEIKVINRNGFTFRYTISCTGEQTYSENLSIYRYNHDTLRSHVEPIKEGDVPGLEDDVSVPEVETPKELNAFVKMIRDVWSWLWPAHWYIFIFVVIPAGLFLAFIIIFALSILIRKIF